MPECDDCGRLHTLLTACTRAEQERDVALAMARGLESWSSALEVRINSNHEVIQDIRARLAAMTELAVRGQDLADYLRHANITNVSPRGQRLFDDVTAALKAAGEAV